MSLKGRRFITWIGLMEYGLEYCINCVLNNNKITTKYISPEVLSNKGLYRILRYNCEECFSQILHYANITGKQIDTIRIQFKAKSIYTFNFSWNLLHISVYIDFIFFFLIDFTILILSILALNHLSHDMIWLVSSVH